MHVRNQLFENELRDLHKKTYTSDDFFNIVQSVQPALFLGSKDAAKRNYDKDFLQNFVMGGKK